MGVFTFTDECTSPVAAARLFEAWILDSHNLIPKLLPEVVKSIEIQGDGGAGTIRQINFAEAITSSYVKYRVDELDKDTFTYNYTLIEGGELLVEKIESITHESKFEPAPEGGCKFKIVSTYYTKENVGLKEEEVMVGREKSLELYKIMEGYLLQNPEVYAH